MESDTTLTSAETEQWLTTPLTQINDGQATATSGVLASRRSAALRRQKSRLIGTASTKIGASRRRTRTPRIQTEPETLLAAELVNKTWSIYKASPLYSFSINLLKNYSKSLTVELEAAIKKGVAVGLDSETTCKATFSVFEGFAYDQDGAQSVKLSVSAKRKQISDNEPSEVLTLLLTGRMNDASKSISGSFTCCPVMLTRGQVMFTDIVMAWMQNQFDCSIYRMSFSQYHLAWMVAMWAGILPENTSPKSVMLVYSVPETEGVDTLTLSINPHDCKRLWVSVHNADSSSFLESEVHTFHKSLELHFYQHFKIHLSCMQLSSIGTPIVFVSSEGKMKMYSVEHVDSVLQLLVDLIVEEYPDRLQESL
ncbi:PREDICTED: centromere protein L-like [Priapulus caudatus]|uniref:Centromere protein L n=1 Tax=Priapulus caudatus TaxID=37621 RepID=A0ABM1F1W7_PRICU|nr:PREDICTED: centromere protein L-like [Priapulus caudatus]XP_014678438.1 PREDICTED: centromere protein L-like [Priapulus caudatus]